MSNELDPLIPYIPWALGIWVFNHILGFVIGLANRGISQQVLNLQKKLIDKQAEEIKYLKASK